MIKNKNILITGGNSGIGFFAIINLLKTKNILYVVIKNEFRKNEFLKKIEAYFDKNFLSKFLNIIENCDLSDLENIKKIKKSKLKKKITVEIDTIKQLKKILDQEIDIVLLDNMTEKQISQCLKIVKKKFLCEASGNINLKNIKSYAKTKIDRISIGQLTHSIDNIDFGLEI